MLMFGLIQLSGTENPGNDARMERNRLPRADRIRVHRCVFHCILRTCFQ